MSYGKPNFGLLFQAQDNFNPFQAVGAEQQNRALNLEQAALAQKQEASQLGAILQSQQIRAAKDAAFLQMQQADKAAQERESIRKQNKIETEKKMKQDLYIREKDMQQRDQLAKFNAQQAALRAQEQREQAAQNARNNILLQGEVSNKLQERRLESQKQIQELKFKRKDQEAAQQKLIDQQVQQAMDNDDFATVARLVGPMKAQQLQKAKQSISKESSEGAKFEGNVRDVIRSVDLLDRTIGQGKGGGTLAYLDYAPEALQDFTLSPEQREIRLARERAADAIGRLQSGGAINRDEAARFMRFLPSAGDDTQTIRLKLNQLKDSMKERLEAKGIRGKKLQKILNQEQSDITPNAQTQRTRNILDQQSRQIDQRMKMIEQQLGIGG